MSSFLVAILWGMVGGAIVSVPFYSFMLYRAEKRRRLNAERNYRSM